MKLEIAQQTAKREAEAKTNKPMPSAVNETAWETYSTEPKASNSDAVYLITIGIPILGILGGIVGLMSDSPYNWISVIPIIAGIAGLAMNR